MARKLHLFIFVFLFTLYGCGNDDPPKKGNIEFQLRFSHDLSSDESAAVALQFAFPGGIYDLKEGISFTTDEFATASGENIGYQITSVAYEGCLTVHVDAVYGGKTIQSDVFEFGEDCANPTSSSYNTQTKNIVIP